jgi:hypothetical protein
VVGRGRGGGPNYFRGIPITTTTRPVFTQYQQVGVLYAQSSDADGKKLVLPLFGKRIDTRTDKWNYYTLSDGYHSFKLAITNRGKNCFNDEYGCEELFSDDVVTLPQFTHDFVVSLYEKNGPKYSPDIF